MKSVERHKQLIRIEASPISRRIASRAPPQLLQSPVASARPPTTNQNDGYAASMRALKAEYQKSDKRSRVALRRELAQLYATAEHLRDNEDAWLEFCSMDEWQEASARTRRPAFHHHVDPLRHVINFMVGYETRSQQQTASKYYRALKEPFARRVPADHIPELIKSAGGIESLARAAAKTRGVDQPAKQPSFATLKVKIGAKSEKLIKLLREGKIVAAKLRQVKTGASFLLEIQSVKTKNSSAAKTGT